MDNKPLKKIDIDKRISEITMNYIESGYVIDGDNQWSNKIVALYKGNEEIVVKSDYESFFSNDCSDSIRYKYIKVLKNNEIILQENYYSLYSSKPIFFKDLDFTKRCINLSNERHHSRVIRSKEIRYDDKTILSIIKNRKGNKRIKKSDIVRVTSDNNFFEIKYMKNNQYENIRLRKGKKQ